MMSLSLPKTWNLPSEVVCAFGPRLAEQRACFRQGHLLLVLQHPGDAIHDQREPIAFLRRPGGDWHCTDVGKATTCLDALLDSYEALAQQLDDRLAEATVARHFFEVLSRLRPLALGASEMSRLLHQAGDWVPDDPQLERRRARARAVARQLEVLVARAEDGRDFDLAQLAEEQADISNQMVVSSQRLNFLVAMLLPMTAVASLFGMNLISGVDDGSATLFWLVVIFSVLLGAVMSFFIGRLPRQLRRESRLEDLITELEATRHKLAQTSGRRSS